MYLKRFLSLSVILLLTLVCLEQNPFGQTDTTSNPNQLDFRLDIEPIFSRRCLHCHGPSQAAGGLRLDHGKLVLKGDKKGLVIIPGDSSASRLIHAISGTSGILMPLQGEPLTTDEINQIRTWIDQGAPYEVTTNQELVKSNGGHWAFQKIGNPTIPAITDSNWVKNPIDAFVLKNLENKGLKPSPKASRATLMRRLYLDLLGLPPSPFELQAFMNDSVPDAYERLVRRLLSSPHYGERWGRHWLDLARYADSDGFEKDGIRPHAWRYREWVIKAINQDLPYNQFVIEQLAGDLLPDAGIEQKVATGFHRNTLTNREGGVDKEQFRIEQVVDRTNTTGSVFLGLTLGCAQCHDHKYDPITQKEYFELFSFQNEAIEKGVPANLGTELAAYQRTKQDWDLIQAKLLQKMDTEKKPLEETLATKLDKWEAQNPYPLLNKWKVLDPISFTASKEGDEGPVELSKQVDGSLLASEKTITEHTNYTVNVKSFLTPITAFRLEVLTDPSLPELGPGRGNEGKFILTEVTIETPSLKEGDKPLKLEIQTALALQEEDEYEVYRTIDGEETTGWSLGGHRGPNHNRQVVFILKETTGSYEGMDFTFKLEQRAGDYTTLGRFRLSATTAPKQIMQSLVPLDIEHILAVTPSERSLDQTNLLLDYYVKQQPRIRELLATIEGHHKAKPQQPNTLAQTISQSPNPPKTYLHVRGDFLRKGQEVKPATPSILPPLRSRKDHPDRLDLARWIVDPSNPLTRRVMVNRVWEKLFGRGLVASSDDFGTRGELPSHPELLDWLSQEFYRLGWRQKNLIELIVLSNSYQQTSVTRTDLQALDPDNIWIARQNRFRVEAEITRDLFLSVGNLLNSRIGGRSIRPPLPEDVAKLGYSSGIPWDESIGNDIYRRGLYIHFQRTVPFPMLMAFDSPDSNTSCLRRTRSNTPLQALTLLNDSLFVECARSFARSIASKNTSNQESQIIYAFRKALAREPDQIELNIMKNLLLDQKQLFLAESGITASLVGENFPNNLSYEDSASWFVLARTILNLDEFLTRE